MIKQSLRFVADKSAKVALDGKEFSPRIKLLVSMVIRVSIGVLVLDFLIAGIRYGNIGLQDWYYYATILILLGICYNVVRDNAETTLKEMRHSKNWFVKICFFLAYGVVAISAIVINFLCRFDGVKREHFVGESSHNEPYNGNWNNMGSPGYDRASHMNDFMIGARDDPPW